MRVTPEAVPHNVTSALAQKAWFMLLTRWFRFISATALVISILASLNPAVTLAHEGHEHDPPEVLGPGGAPPAGSGPVDVAGFTRGIDGHTLETWIDGAQVGIGLIGVDVFEANTVCGAQAAGFLQGMLYGGFHAEEDAELIFDEDLRRMYYVYTPDGASLAHALVQSGLAVATGEGRDADELLALQTSAQNAGAGCVWEDDAADILPLGPPDAGVSFAERSALAVPTGFQAQSYVSGLNFPTDFAFLPDGRVLVAEKSGLVRIAVNGSVLATPFIDLRDQVNDYWDRGLLSVEVDPNFDVNGYVYFLFTYEHDETSYSGTKTGRLIRVTASGDTANPATEVVLLGTQAADSCDDLPVGTDCIPSDGPSHSTGGLRFAPDGTLFATLGEGANFNASNPQALRAQDLDSLGGKLVRIDANGQGLADNPFWTGNANDVRSKIWASGLRNAYRFTLRPSDGTPYIGDVGWVSWEEINVATPGANFGWPCYEGAFQQGSYSSETACQQLYSAGNASPPVITWDHTTGGSSVTGGVFYNGTSYPAEYDGAYFYGDYARNFIDWAQFGPDNTVQSGPNSFDDAAGGPVSFRIGPDGDVYYLSITTGEIRHVAYVGAPSGSESGFVSDLTWDSSSNGWGPVERDQSNGEDAAEDGGPLTINGSTFSKGIGVHAPSEVVIGLDGTCSQFISTVGVDDEVGDNGSVEFAVYSESTLLASSGVLTGADGPQSLTANLDGVTQLRLVVTDAGDNVYWDHADWADGWIECGQDQTPPTVTATSPENGAVDVPTSANVTATFTEPLDVQSLEGNVVLLDGATPVDADVSFDSNSGVLTLDPASALALDTIYDARITGGVDGVTDSAGNPLAADVAWSFTTAATGGPVPTISSPLATDTFIVGDEITYSGSAVDGSGAPLPDSALRWRVLIYHCNHIDCHAHQVLDETGTSGGAFTVPDHGDQYYFYVELTATDGGQSNSTSVEIHPETVDVTLNSTPSGLEVNLAGEQVAGPLTRPIVVGSVITVSVPSPQGAYTFESWSDGGARVHTVEVGATDLTLTATFAGDEPEDAIYLSDLTPAAATNHWGPVELDQSNGEQGAGDGGPLTIDGVVYPKGLGVHAPSTVTYEIDTCSMFRASIGLDDEVGDNGTVVFEVLGDGGLLYQSPVILGADAPLDIAVDIDGVTTLMLRVTDAGDNVYWDHADWGDARITCDEPAGDTTPPVVSAVDPTDGVNAVPVDATVSATFSEAIDEATLAGNVTLAEQGGGPVAATLDYDETTASVTLTPSSDLSADTTYVATVSGGVDGVADLADNPLAADVTWTFTTAPDTTGSSEIFISDMAWDGQTNGWGPVERDQSNGEQGASDGNPLTIGGTVYSKGLGVHAAAEVIVALDGTCALFSATVGVDDEVGPNGSVTFEVWGDGALLASEAGVTGADAGQLLSADITGVTTLRLVVTGAGDGIAYDHADWADAKVVCDGSAPEDTTPPAVVSVNPADGASNVAVGANVTATFSEDLDPASLSGNVELREQGAATPESVTVSYSAATDRLTINPDSDLAAGTTYVVTISGAAGGVTDVAGNPLADDEVWSFTTAAELSGEQFYISDLAWDSSANGWGPVERDQSNGEDSADDGAPLTIGSQVFAKGVGSHSLSEVIVTLDGTCTVFAASVGIDAEVGANGSAAFVVYGDGSLLYTSPVLEGGDAAQAVLVDITGVTTLRLVTTNGGDNVYYDHTDWGEARVYCEGTGQGDTTPPEITAQTPEPDAVDVDPESAITVTFSEELDPATVAGAVTLEEQGGPVVLATVEYDNLTQTITVTPDSTLTDETTYIVTVSGVTDLAGNALTPDAVWSFTTSAAALPPLFEPVSKVAAGTNAHGVTVADVNSDNDLDLVVATTGDDAVVILLGDGEGGFAATGSYPTGVHPKFATTGDFNNDGDLDFASANQDDTGGNDVSVYLGNGDGSFTLAGHFAACANPHEVAPGDVNEDGDLDLVVVCWGGSVANLLLGNGDGTFAAATDLDVGSAPHSVVVEDFNGDGDLDIATADHNSNTVSVLLGNGDGTFAARLIQAVDFGPHSMRGGDVNRDGDIDLVTANDAGDSVTVLLGNGDGSFARGDFAVGDEPKGVALGDIDGDGWLDIISANIHGTYPCCSGETSISVLFNDHSGGFVGLESAAVVSSPFSVATGDFNEDGRLDVVSANWHTNDVGIFLGNR